MEVKNMKVYQKRRGFSVILFLALTAAVVLLLVSLVSCGEEGQLTPVTTEPPTPPPVTVTVPITITPPLDPYTFLPTDEQIRRITAGIQENLPPAEETGHVPPPTGQIDTLEAICRTLAGSGLLLNPECIFNRAWATSYTLPDTGMVYQAVSLATPEEGERIDDLLGRVGTWEFDLAIGGILVYQEANFSEFALPVGVYLVVLNSDLTFQLYGENNEPLASGVWQLRQLNGGAAAPVALVTPNQLCFSELVMQACLNLVSPGLGVESMNAKLAGTAVSNLQTAGWLPANFVVNAAGAMSSIEGVEKVRTCTSGEEQKSLLLETCFPNLVAAAAEPIFSTVSQAKPVIGAKPVMEAKISAPSLQATGLISEVVTGVGVIEVLETLTGEVFNLEGAVTDLGTGSYRVDLLELSDGSSLFQLISVDGVPFYLAAIPIAGEGVPVEAVDNIQTKPPGDIIEPGLNEVLIDGINWKICRTWGWGSICTTNKKWAYWCVSWARSGWCYANGAFLR